MFLGARSKDKLEVAIWHKIQKKELTLPQAHGIFTNDWTKAYYNFGLDKAPGVLTHE